jgi:hypothetical protein
MVKITGREIDGPGMQKSKTGLSALGSHAINTVGGGPGATTLQAAKKYQTIFLRF